MYFVCTRQFLQQRLAGTKIILGMKNQNKKSNTTLLMHRSMKVQHKICYLQSVHFRNTEYTFAVQRRKPQKISVCLEFLKCVLISFPPKRKSVQRVYIYCTDLRCWRGNLDTFSVQICVLWERKIWTHLRKQKEIVGGF